jgi:hypothetical protein
VRREFKDPTLMAFRLDARQKAVTEALAKARNVSGSEIVRRALDSYIVKSSGAPSPEEREYIFSKAGPLAEEQVDDIARGLESLSERLAAIEQRIGGGDLT